MKTVYRLTMALVLTAMGVQSALAAATNRYVVKGNPNALAPYHALTNAAADIQTAINAAIAANGDQVLVAAGTYDVGGSNAAYYGGYLTNRVYINKAITVRSIDNDPTTTIIKGAWDPVMTNGARAIRCVFMIEGSTLIGFTVTNGATLSTNEIPVNIGQNAQAGGIYGRTVAATVSNCIITGNAGLGDNVNGMGGGAIIYATVLNSTISGNWAQYRGGAGAESAILSNCTVVGNSTPGNGAGALRGTLYNCLVSNNTASLAGGGISGWDVNVRIRAYNCTIVNNRALGAPGGGGGASLAILSNCTVAFNVATNVANTGRGGGAVDSILIGCQVFSNLANSGGGTYGGSLTNCVLAYNVGLGGGACRPFTAYNCLIYGNYGYGGGMYLVNGTTVDGCTIVGNNTGILNENGNTTNFIINCIVYSNQTANWVKGAPTAFFAFSNSCTTPEWAGWAAGNITNNPRFVAFGSSYGTNLVGANYHLSSGSPCINTGVNEAWMTGAFDLDGMKRIDQGSLLVDMGAYEYVFPGGTLIQLR